MNHLLNVYLRTHDGKLICAWIKPEHCLDELAIFLRIKPAFISLCFWEGREQFRWEYFPHMSCGKWVLAKDCLDCKECSNDTVYEFYIEKGDHAEDKQNQLDAWKKGKTVYGFLARTLMNDLCNMGYLEPGQYVIRVSW